MAISKKAQVGEMVKVIKRLPYRDQMNVNIGDIGVVNYVAGTGKYSVQINGKKNPHSKLSRYGKYGDFWIPFDCCEIVSFIKGDKVKINISNSYFNGQSGIVESFDRGRVLVVLEEHKNRIVFNEKDLIKLPPSTTVSVKLEETTELSEDIIKQFLFDSTDELEVIPDVTWDDVPEDIKELVEIGIYSKEEALAKCSASIIEDNMPSTKKIKKEVRKMILNQKVVDLYFERKKNEISEEFKVKFDKIIDKDENRIFLKKLEDEFNEYILKHEDDFENKYKANFITMLPLTPKSKEEYDKLEDKLKSKQTELMEIKEEVIAMLSGCSTYEQEMAVLRSYHIVMEDRTHMSN